MISVALLMTGISADALRAHEPEGSHPWAVYFSPNGGATQAVVEALGRARETILLQAYTFTSVPIATALVEAHQRGVRVEAILDREETGARYMSADFLAHAGIPIRIDGQHAITDDKAAVIDGETLITGSFNFTNASERENADNLLLIYDPALAARYTENWKIHAAHSARYALK
jgi:phosphatidylserine/phosphatidylglycerophosphate/cardiolipin synthase-like enzyme